MKKEALDQFGRILMERGRDRTVVNWDKILDGTMKGKSCEAIKQRLAHLSPEQIEVVRWLVPQIVDTSLHYVLWALEQENSISLLIKDEHGEMHNLREASDGLPGELYTEDGWIARFSKQRKGAF